MNICVIGTGYVGLVTGASLAFLGNDVTCVDIDSEKIEKLQTGISPIYEPGIEELLETGISTGRLWFTTDLEAGAANADVIYIAVGTPPQPDGGPDLSQVKAAAKSIGRAILDNYRGDFFRVIINKSTVPVGSGNWVEMLVRQEIKDSLQKRASANNVSADNGNNHGKANGNGHRTEQPFFDQVATTFTVVSNPEFLKEGTAISDTFYPDRIVVGANNPRAFRILNELYRPLLEQNFEPPLCIAPRPDEVTTVPMLATDLASAEMIKYAANSFLAMKISFINEIANICEHSGADVGRVAEGIGLDGRIGRKFLNAGVGWGGSCFGKDVSALIEIAEEYGYKPQLLQAAREVNSRQRQVVIQKLQNALRIIKGKTIGILGLAFKPDTDDVRDAPSLDIAAALVKMGARVKVYDPVAMESFQINNPDLEVVYALNVEDLAADCDAVLVVTDWDEFRRFDLKNLYQLMAGNVLVDGRNIFEPEKAAQSGFRYIGIGREFLALNQKAAAKSFAGIY